MRLSAAQHIASVPDALDQPTFTGFTNRPPQKLYVRAHRIW